MRSFLSATLAICLVCCLVLTVSCGNPADDVVREVPILQGAERLSVQSQENFEDSLYVIPEPYSQAGPKALKLMSGWKVEQKPGILTFTKLEQDCECIVLVEGRQFLWQKHDYDPSTSTRVEVMRRTLK